MNGYNNKSRFRFRSIYLIYLLLFGIGVYLVIYHGPHLWNILPLLIIFLCPLMHLFHHGHGKHQDHGAERSRREEMEEGIAKEKKDKDKHMGCH